MKTNFLQLVAFLFTTALFAQAGHIMQGVGAVNMSMGGAATGQPLDISGAMYWNPAAISVFNENELKLDVGLFFSSPELNSTFGPFSGTTEDDRGTSVMPNLAYLWSKEDSKHTFGVSAFGISGFGVTFPEDSNYPQDLMGNPNPNYDPSSSSNPINFPQMAGGFGHIESDYMLLQVGLTWAYKLSDKFSVGVQPNFNYASLELMPNPTMYPSQTAGYPSTDKASALGFGAQFGLFYKSDVGFKAGVSYKTTQSFGDFEFDNTYLDGTTAKNKFQMDYPSIFSVGLGYSKSKFDLALDYRLVNYENTEGFEKSGWAIADSGPTAGFPTGAVAGFGWQNISIVSAGLQYKGINKLPLRIGYTYSSNPIRDELTFFSIPATAIIKNAYQIGLSYEVNDNWKLDAVFHYGDSGGKTSGSMLSPIPDQDFNGDGNPDGPWNATTNPLGVVPGSSVSYDMTTSMIMVGVSYKFKKATKEE